MINLIPWLLLALGLAAALMRSLLLLHVDDRGLVQPGQPVTTVLLALTALAAALVWIPVLKDRGNGSPAAGGGKRAALGAVLLAVGLVVTVLPAGAGNVLEYAWKILGLAAAAALCLVGWNRWQGKQPDVWCYVPVCVFMILHMISRYRPWSGNPQWVEYAYELAGVAFLLLFAYQQAAAVLGMDSRKQRLLSGLAGSFCCLAAVPWGYCPLLSLGAAFWMLAESSRLLAAPESTPVEREDEAL